MTEISDDGQHVYVTVVDADAATTRYRCQYAIGADGGKTVGPYIGAVLEGSKHLEDKVSVHFKADLSQYWDGKLKTRIIDPLLSKSHLWLTNL